jgi:hypothetical protein
MDFLTSLSQQIFSVAGLVGALGWGCAAWLARENARKERFAREDRKTALEDARQATKATAALTGSLSMLDARLARLEGLSMGRNST